jgi:MFS transporter, YNFM family, putative membrane transport protein
VDRIGSKKTLTIGVAVGICGILLTLTMSIPVILAGLALCCSGVFVAQASTNSYLGKAATTDRALAIGLYGTAYYGGGAVGAAAPGLMWSDYGWVGCVALIGVVQLITITLASTLWPQHKTASV